MIKSDSKTEIIPASKTDWHSTLKATVKEWY